MTGFSYNPVSMLIRWLHRANHSFLATLGQTSSSFHIVMTGNPFTFADTRHDSNPAARLCPSRMTEPNTQKHEVICS